MTLFNANPELHKTEADAPFQGTHVGQAHIAGTGPDGVTCRECKYFAAKKEDWPDYYLGGPTKGNLKQARCDYDIPGKANKVIPHTARACVLFEKNENPPPAFKPKG